MATQFLGWQETDPKKDISARLTEGCRAFARKYGRPATVVRVHPTTVLPAGVTLPVERTRTVPRDQVWPGADLDAPLADDSADTGVSDIAQEMVR